MFANKKFFTRVSALLLALMLAVGAQTACAYNKTLPTETVISNAAKIKAVQRTNFVSVLSAETGLYALFDTDGVQRTDYVLSKCAYVAYGCFTDTKPDDTYINEEGETVTIPQDPINKKAFVNTADGFVSQYEYGLVRVLNGNWALCCVVRKASKTEFDYRLDSKTYYYVDRCDIYSLAGGTHKVQSLTREVFTDAAAHGEYLSVAYRDGSVRIYDANFTDTNLKASKLKTSPYGVVDYALIDKYTGRVIYDGCSACTENNTPVGTRFIINCPNYAGKPQYGICTLEGELLMPPGQYSVTAANAEYALLSDGEHVGLYSFESDLEVVPCDYDSILTSKQAVDAYDIYGYVCGVTGTERHYYSLLTGDLTYAVDVAANKLGSIGGTLYKHTSLSGYDFYTPDGKKLTLSDVRLYSTRGSGRLVIARSYTNRLYGVISAQGDIAVKYEFVRKPVVTDDDRIIILKYNGLYDLIRVAWPEE